MSYGTEGFSSGSQGFHLLTNAPPQAQTGVRQHSGRMVSPGAAWPWSRSNQVVSDAGWRR